MGSTVNIGNWGGMYSPLQQFHNLGQANADNWASTYLEADEKWRALAEQRREDAQANYEKALENEDKWRKIQLGIALLQQAAAFYFADKQYQAAKEAQEHQREIWRTEKEWAQRYQDLWYNKYRPLELALIERIRAKFDDPNFGKARYTVVKRRALAAVRSQYGKAYDKIRKCYDPRCVGEICHSKKMLAFDEAKAAVAAIDKAYRFEEQLADTKKAQAEESMFKLAQHGRGMVASSLTALNAARQAAQIAATYDPQQGYQNATGALFGQLNQLAADRVGQYSGTADINKYQGNLFETGLSQPSVLNTTLIQGGAGSVGAVNGLVSPYAGGSQSNLSLGGQLSIGSGYFDTPTAVGEGGYNGE